VVGSNGVVRRHDKVETSIYARTLASTSSRRHGDRRARDDVGDVLIDALLAAGVTELKVRSVLTCESRSVPVRSATDVAATGKLVDIGEAVVSSRLSRSASPARS